MSHVERDTLLQMGGEDLLSNCDLLLVWPPAGLHLLVDGSPGRGQSGVPLPRRALFEIAAAAWPDLLDRPPAEALEFLNQSFRAFNREHMEHRFFASAALVRAREQPGAFDVAEVGDCKVYRLSAESAEPVFAEDLPGSVIQGALGTDSPEIRAARVGCAEGEQLALLTDGLWRLLRDAGHLDEHGLGAPDFSRAARANRALVNDDATLYVLHP